MTVERVLFVALCCARRRPNKIITSVNAALPRMPMCVFVARGSLFMDDDVYVGEHVRGFFVLFLGVFFVAVVKVLWRALFWFNCWI